MESFTRRVVRIAAAVLSAAVLATIAPSAVRAADPYEIDAILSLTITWATCAVGSA